MFYNSLAMTEEHHNFCNQDVPSTSSADSESKEDASITEASGVGSCNTSSHPRNRQLKSKSTEDAEEDEGVEENSFLTDNSKHIISLGKEKNQLEVLRVEKLLDMAVYKKRHTDLTDVTQIAAPRSMDSNHVSMPFYSKRGSNDRWRDIKGSLYNVLEGRVFNGQDLMMLILQYNKPHQRKWDFDGLLLFFNDLKPYELTEVCSTLVKMAKIALDIEKIVPMSIPFLKRGKNQSIALSKEQIACLLAHAFFCTYPMRNVDPVKDKHSFTSDSLQLPSINFSSLFKLNVLAPALAPAKLRCIFNYFKRATDESYGRNDKVIFKRQVIKSGVKWEKSKNRFTELYVSSFGQIERQKGFLQIDFANKFVGGGVLGRGCVQEEIWFLASPELIISRLFTEALEPDEVLIITGSELYSDYKGYSSSFTFDGNYTDQLPRVSNVKLSQMVAMDAMKFFRTEDQFNKLAVDRELNKAYCGFFCDTKGTNGRLPAVATGNWGCGAFGGDKHLKSLIQMMAAAEAGRDVCYFTHHDIELVHRMHKVHSLIRQHNLTVGNVYAIIMNYVLRLQNGKCSAWKETLYDYILSTYGENCSSPHNEMETSV